MSVENDQEQRSGEDSHDVGAGPHLPEPQPAPDGAPSPGPSDGGGGPFPAPPGHVQLHAVGRVVGAYRPRWSGDEEPVGDEIPVLRATFVSTSADACIDWLLRNQEHTRQMVERGEVGMFVLDMPEQNIVTEPVKEPSRIISPVQ